MHENQIGELLVGVAIEVHRSLGPGLLESVYEIILMHELPKKGLRAERQVPISIEYDGSKFDEGFRADLLIESRVIVELKCVQKLNKNQL